MKTLIVQNVLRPEPSQPIEFRGTLLLYWQAQQGRPIRAQRLTIESRGQVTDEHDQPKRIGDYRRPVFVLFSSADGDDRSLIEVRHADNGTIMDTSIWVDDETVIDVAGCYCSRQEGAHTINEIRDDMPTVKRSPFGQMLAESVGLARYDEAPRAYDGTPYDGQSPESMHAIQRDLK